MHNSLCTVCQCRNLFTLIITHFSFLAWCLQVHPIQPLTQQRKPGSPKHCWFLQWWQFDIISNGSKAVVHLRSHLNWVLWGFPLLWELSRTHWILPQPPEIYRHITAQRFIYFFFGKNLPRWFQFTAKVGTICFYFTKTIITCGHLLIHLSHELLLNF